MTTLSAASPFFVRCLKPNMAKVQDNFDSNLVLNQLRYSGMLETVRIRRAGFPVRREFNDFLFRYRVMFRSIPKMDDDKKRCSLMLTKTTEKAPKQDWQIGLTKVFLREVLEV